VSDDAKTLHFVAAGLPGQPVRWIWDRPDGAVNGYLVVTTEHPFPPEMASEFFAGRMREFFRETPLGPEVAGHQVGQAAPFTAVLYLDDRGRWREASGLREAPLVEETTLALDPIEATQPRTYNRARWSPLPVPTDREVAIFVRSDRPDDDSLGAMLSGVIDADYTVSARGDGFIDTVTAVDFRVHYAAVAVDKFQHRRPLRLSVGGFQRLEQPAFLEEHGQSKVQALMDRVIEQLEIDVALRSTQAADFEASMRRARDLDPNNAELDRIQSMARYRFQGDD